MACRANFSRHCGRRIRRFVFSHFRPFHGDFRRNMPRCVSDPSERCGACSRPCICVCDRPGDGARAAERVSRMRGHEAMNSSPATKARPAARGRLSPHRTRFHDDGGAARRRRAVVDYSAPAAPASTRRHGDPAPSTRPPPPRPPLSAPAVRCATPAALDRGVRRAVATRRGARRRAPAGKSHSGLDSAVPSRAIAVALARVLAPDARACSDGAQPSLATGAAGSARRGSAFVAMIEMSGRREWLVPRAYVHARCARVLAADVAGDGGRMRSSARALQGVSATSSSRSARRYSPEATSPYARQLATGAKWLGTTFAGCPRLAGCEGLSGGHGGGWQGGGRRGSPCEETAEP